MSIWRTNFAAFLTYTFVRGNFILSDSNKTRVQSVVWYYPAGIYLSKVNYGNTKTMCKICSSEHSSCQNNVVDNRFYFQLTGNKTVIKGNIKIWKCIMTYKILSDSMFAKSSPYKILSSCSIWLFHSFCLCGKIWNLITRLTAIIQHLTL